MKIPEREKKSENLSSSSRCTLWISLTDRENRDPRSQSASHGSPNFISIICSSPQITEIGVVSYADPSPNDNQSKDVEIQVSIEFNFMGFL